MLTTVRRMTIGDDDAGTLDTVALMGALMRDGVADPLVRATVTNIVRFVPENDWLGQLRAIRDWCSQHIIFLRDPSGVELLHDANWMLQQIAENGTVHVDCDDAAILAGTLAGAIGAAVDCVVVAFLDRDAPFSHTWVQASPLATVRSASPGQVWIEFDVTRTAQAIPVDAISRYRIIPIM